jgi:hypothetical protein
MPLNATVTPNVTVTESTQLTPAVLNALGTPTISITGTVDGTAGIGASSITNAHLQDNIVNARVLDETDSFTVAGLTDTGNAAVTGTLSVGGSATLNGNVTLGDAAADTLDIKGKLGAATATKTTAVDADQLFLVDSADSNAIKTILRSNLSKGFLNVQTAHVAGTQTFSGQTWTTVTSLTVSITPRSTSSTILLFALINGGIAVNGTQVYARWVRNDGASDTVIGSGTAAGSRQAVHTAMLDGGSGANGLCSCSMLFVDSPATTSARTYKVQLYGNNTSGNFYTGRGANDTDSALYARAGCFLAAIEIT